MFNPFFLIEGKFSFHFFLYICLFLSFQAQLLKGCSILYWVNFCLLLDWQEVLIFTLKRNWPAMYGCSTEISVFYMKSECQNLFSSWCQNCVSISAFFLNANKFKNNYFFGGYGELFMFCFDKSHFLFSNKD